MDNNKNLGIVIANAAINSINNSSKAEEIYEKLYLSQLENEKTASLQEKKTWQYIISAVCAISFTLFSAAALSEQATELFKTAAGQAQNIGNLYGAFMIDGETSRAAHNTNIAKIAQERLTQLDHSLNSLNSQTLEMSSRLIEKTS